MKIVPSLWQLRASVSDDGRIARFFLTFKGGQHSAFLLPFHRIGLFLRAISNTVTAMSARLEKSGAGAEISEGLAHALSVKTVAGGRDSETGDKLLWIETVESGPFAFRLTPETAIMLADVVRLDGEPSPSYSADGVI